MCWSSETVFFFFLRLSFEKTKMVGNGIAITYSCVFVFISRKFIRSIRGDEIKLEIQNIHYLRKREQKEWKSTMRWKVMVNFICHMWHVSPFSRIFPFFCWKTKLVSIFNCRVSRVDAKDLFDGNFDTNVTIYILCSRAFACVMSSRRQSHLYSSASDVRNLTNLNGIILVLIGSFDARKHQKFNGKKKIHRLRKKVMKRRRMYWNKRRRKKRFLQWKHKKLSTYSYVSMWITRSQFPYTHLQVRVRAHLVWNFSAEKSEQRKTLPETSPGIFMYVWVLICVTYEYCWQLAHRTAHHRGTSTFRCEKRKHIEILLRLQHNTCEPHTARHTSTRAHTDCIL